MPKQKRHDGRAFGELRPLRITVDYVGSADGSCLIELGRTRVICTASFVEGVPKWREDSGMGWVTAEYGMLPASTPGRKRRPLLKPDSRGVEIQRFIGRVLRSVVRFKKIPGYTICLDCDVLEADGGTRTTSITGAYVALARAITKAARQDLCSQRVLNGAVAGVSVGIVDGRSVLDLDYHEDSSAAVDMNVAMTSAGKFVEVQGTGEGGQFTMDELEKMLTLARRGIRKLLKVQKEAINKRARKK